MDLAKEIFKSTPNLKDMGGGSGPRRAHAHAPAKSPTTPTYTPTSRPGTDTSMATSPIGHG
jgi:hypothetical protein